VYFGDEECRLHTIDLGTGSERTNPGETCSWFRVWGELIAIGKPTVAPHAWVTAVDFGGEVIAPDTGKPQTGPHCPHPVGAACVTFSTDLRETGVGSLDPSSAATIETFEVRGPHDEHFRGDAVRPHPELSPDHAMLWRDAAGQTLAFVAARLEGSVGPQLVVIDDTRVSVTALSSDDAIDQRRISGLRAFVPISTPPEDIDAVVRERQKYFAAATDDPVRFMEYAAASSAHVPCSR